MSTYLLLWNPAKWTFTDWPQALAAVAQQGSYIRQWSCVSKHPVPGDPVLLKKTGRGLTGIIASGTVIAAPYMNSDWGKGKETLHKQYVYCRFDGLADYTKGEILPFDDKADLGYTPQSSGTRIEETKAASLLQRFQAYIKAPVIVPTVRVSADRKRVGIRVGLRYEILDRDAHTCRYCGRSSPQVELHVDHVVSQASWREQHGNLDEVNERSNLVTACADCNAGKSRKNGHPPQEDSSV